MMMQRISKSRDVMIYQIKNLNVGDASQCLQKFKSNNFLGLIIVMNILIGKLI